MHGGGPLAAVLFDMDGTLVDSEVLWDRALQALAARYGATLSPATRQAMTGRGAADSMRIFYRAVGADHPDRDADDAYLWERMVELFTTDLGWRPGARELVAKVRRAGLPCALVTSTGRRLVEVALDGTLGRDTFDTVVCGDEVRSQKPHPEPYLTAARRLGVPVQRCVAVEDSPVGVASARAAGAVVVAVPHTVPLPRLPDVHVVPSLTDVTLAHLTRLVAPTAPRPAARPATTAG